MMAEEFTIYTLTMSSAGCGAVVAYPWAARWWTALAGRVEQYQQDQVDRTVKVLDELFVDVKPKWLKIAYGVVPAALGLLALIVWNQPLMALCGVVIGAVLPDVWVKQQRLMRARQFQRQLVDALFILSSSLRAGLSMTQAFEQLETEMGPPASQEFGLMMKAHRLGLTLEESLQRLNLRMPGDELNLITTAVLVNRETGGEITAILTQLISTIRERKKLSDKVATLTMQGRLQAYIMSAMPVFFAVFIRSVNPHYFDVLFQSEAGRTVLMIAVGLWAAGMWLLRRMSRVDF